MGGVEGWHCICGLIVEELSLACCGKVWINDGDSRQQFEFFNGFFGQGGNSLVWKLLVEFLSL